MEPAPPKVSHDGADARRTRRAYVSSNPVPVSATLPFSRGPRRTGSPRTDAGTLSCTADVSDGSGVREVGVVARPGSSTPDPTEPETRYVDRAECRSTPDRTSRCTYMLEVTLQEAADLTEGTWHVSVPATAKDGATTFVPRATAFAVTRCPVTRPSAPARSGAGIRPARQAGHRGPGTSRTVRGVLGRTAAVRRGAPGALGRRAAPALALLRRASRNRRPDRTGTGPCRPGPLPARAPAGPGTTTPPGR
ncbi:DUF5707 domain-containing protein [Streptomyces caelestis]|uniref:DUF5707 domain-containing protein n=1 Tax=Streptomyces caelestis TaxID=36816 RepID=UPI00364CC9B3